MSVESEPRPIVRVHTTFGDARNCRICRVPTLTRIEFDGIHGVIYDACDEHARPELFEDTYREFLEARSKMKAP